MSRGVSRRATADDCAVVLVRQQPYGAVRGDVHVPDSPELSLEEPLFAEDGAAVVAVEP